MLNKFLQSTGKNVLGKKTNPVPPAPANTQPIQPQPATVTNDQHISIRSSEEVTTNAQTIQTPIEPEGENKILADYFTYFAQLTKDQKAAVFFILHDKSIRLDTTELTTVVMHSLSIRGTLNASNKQKMLDHINELYNNSLNVPTMQPPNHDIANFQPIKQQSDIVTINVQPIQTPIEPKTEDNTLTNYFVYYAGLTKKQKVAVFSALHDDNFALETTFAAQVMHSMEVMRSLTESNKQKMLAHVDNSISSF